MIHFSLTSLISDGLATFTDFLYIDGSTVPCASAGFCALVCLHFASVFAKKSFSLLCIYFRILLKFIRLRSHFETMQPDTKRRLAKVISLTRTVFHWGFIPTVLYLGFKTGPDPGMPPLSVLSLLWQ